MKVLHKIIFTLVVITLIIVQLFWLYGDGRVIKVTPSQFNFAATNDQQQGGISTTSLAIENDVALLQCRLGKGPSYQWPYCGLSIDLGDSMSQGMDLQGFHTIKLDIDFEQIDGESSPSLRLYLRTLILRIRRLAMNIQSNTTVSNIHRQLMAVR